MERQQFKLFDERPILSVSDLVSGIKGDLESHYRDLWVRGELSNLGRPSSGHLYFTVKDEEAQISAVCFRMKNRYLRFQPEDGLQVLVRGSVSIYPPRGQLQLVVEHMEPLGQGALQLAFEQLKTKLNKEGLFDPARKKPLPLLPRRVGVITSSSGAAIQDIIRVLRRRNDRVNIVLCPTRVQGVEACSEICRAIEYLNRRTDIDVIIVGRGGGSIEDLWAFNEESLARAIAQSNIPIISAVGHETDFTIADFVADLRAPTPSAAAEIVCAKREELAVHLQHVERHMAQAFRLLLHQKRQRLHRLASSRAFVDAESRLRFFLQRLDELTLRLHQRGPAIFQAPRQKVVQCERGLEQWLQVYLVNKRQQLKANHLQLMAFSPLSVLERGYAIVSRESGFIVRDPHQVKAGDNLDIRVARGRFRARKE